MEKILSAKLEYPKYGFTITDATLNSMKMDIPIAQGGNGKGMRPMQTMLAALCGCSAVDIIDILKKQKQSYTHFTIEVSGEREKDKEPALWQSVHIQFVMNGEVDANKLYKAAELSITKYCSVAETLRRAGATITFSIITNNTPYQKQ
jgi:putative redox protein